MAQVALTSTSNNRKMSGSPTTGHQPLSKRDKKRQAVESRITTITENFAKEREAHCRAQLGAISRDIHFIVRANAYGNRPLDDSADELFSDVVSQPSATGSIDGDLRAPPLGKFAQRFVDGVNDAMEERDARITDVHSRFQSKGKSLRLDYEFAFATAETERDTLRRAMRDRLIQQIESKKRLLKKEKEQLDAADYSTLAHNNLTLIAPGSPGGPHTNRKTRNTRRNDYEDPSPNEVTNKRKRKMLGDGDIGSPNPAGSRTRQELSGSALWEKINSSSSSIAGVEVRVDSYFSPRELTSHNKVARENVARKWAEKQALLGHDGPGMYNGPANHDADDADGMDLDLNPLLVAPAMDRTGSSHATRSTRALQTAAAENLLHHDPGAAANVAKKGLDEKDSQQMYGQAVLEALALRSHLKETNKDLEALPTSGFSMTEQLEDWAYLCNLDGAG